MEFKTPIYLMLNGSPNLQSVNEKTLTIILGTN